jgi:hypothetical protein
MPVAKHAFVSTKSQGSDSSIVSKNEWNADHALTYTVQTKSANYTVAAGDDLIRCSGTFTLTILAASGSGKVIAIVLDSAGTVTIARTGSDTLGGQTSLTLSTVNDVLYLHDEAAGAWALCYPMSSQAAAYTVAGNNTATAGRIQNLTSLILGTPAFTPTAVANQYTASSPTFFQAIIQNTSNNTAASADIVVENDQGTDTNHYGDLGINSSAFSGAGQLNIPGGVYLYAQGGDLTVGTASANAVHFIANSATSDALTITPGNLASTPNLLEGFTATATSGGTTTLTVSSTYTQQFTGSSAQTVVMPVTTTLTAGMQWDIINSSTSALTIQSSGTNLITAIPAGGSAIIECVLASGTTAASWVAKLSVPMATTAPAAVTPDGTASSGTSKFGAPIDHQHGIVTYSTAPSACTPLAISSAGTNGTAPNRGDHAHRCPGGIADITSQVSVGPSSTTETTIATATLPTNFLAAGTSFRFKFQGTLQLQATSGILTLRMYVGATAGQTVVIASQTSAVAASFCEFEGIATVRTTGASGTYISTGKLTVHNADTTVINARQGGASTTTVDTTATTPVVKMTAQFATSSTTNILLVQNATIEIVKM